MSKVTVQSPANIAFIKYWGVKENTQYIPYNDSISMTLSGCQSTTTILADKNIREDIIEIGQDGTYETLKKTTEKNKKAYQHIARIRAMAHVKDNVRIRTKNSFPSDAGIASSASGFSALTAALLLAYGLPHIVSDKSQLSRLVRLSGSGSAVRSIYGGFVEFLSGDENTSIAHQIADEKYWDLVDIIAIINTEKKTVSSTQGHSQAVTSPYFQTRLIELQPRLKETRLAIREKDFSKLGACIEADTISMHAIMMTSVPPIFYWDSGTIALIQEVIKWRKEGLEAYFSIDAGANVHIICEKKNTSLVETRLENIQLVQSTIYNEPCAGVHEVKEHLF